MSKKQKRLDALRAREANQRFDDLVAVVLSVGFVEVLPKSGGSHRIFQHPDHPLELLNLQPAKKGRNAKPYQVAQVLAVIDRLNLEVL